MAGGMQANPNYSRYPVATGPSNEPQGAYREADARGSYQFAPSYRLNNSPAIGQNPPAVGPVSPANQLPQYNNRGGAMTPQTSPQYNQLYQNQQAPQAYPTNQPIPSGPVPGSNAGAWQNGGYPSPGYNNTNAVPANSGTPAGRYPDGYRIPPMTETPPPRY
jgi:hypothetical protein